MNVSSFVLNHFSLRKGGNESYDVINDVDAYGNNVLLRECYGILDIPHASIQERRKYESETIFELIDDGWCDVTLCNHNGVSPLSIIIEYNLLEEDKIIALLEKIPFEKLPTNLLHHVNSHRLAEYLYKRHFDIDAIDEHGNTPILSAIKRYLELKKYDENDPNFPDAQFLIGELKTLIAFFCTAKANLNTNLPLHVLARASNFEIFRLLKSAGGDINQTDENGNTPLLISCERKTKRSHYVRSLIDLGCNPFKKNKFGEVPLVLIAKDNLLDDDEILDLLKEYFHNKDRILGEKIGIERDVSGISNLLHETQNEKIIKFLIKHGVPVDSFDGKGNTALFLAVERLDIDLVDFLLAQGADPLQEKPLNKKGKPLLGGTSTPLMLIIEKIKLCLQLHANIDDRKKIQAKRQTGELQLCLDIGVKLLLKIDISFERAIEQHLKQCPEEVIKLLEATLQQMTYFSKNRPSCNPFSLWHDLIFLEPFDGTAPCCCLKQ